MSLTNGAVGGADYRYRFRYETLRSLLNRNNRSLQLLSDLEADLNHLHYLSDQVKRPVWRLIEEAFLMSQECNLLTGEKHNDLYDVILKVLGKAKELFDREKTSEKTELVVGLDSDEALDTALVGGKAAGVARLTRLIGDRVPPGFVLTTASYRRLLEKNGLHERIHLLLKDLDVMFDQPQFKSITATVRNWIRKAEVPGEVEEALRENAARTPGVGPTGWAARSSAVFEGGYHSFAGLFESELRIESENLTKAYLNVVASRFLDRAVQYRVQRGIREVDAPMAVLFMPMVEPAASGVIYTIDPEAPGSNRMVMNAVPGLGNRVAQGTVRADAFHFTGDDEPKLLKAVPASKEEGKDYHPDYITDNALLEVAALASRVARLAGYDMDIEWAVANTMPTPTALTSSILAEMKSASVNVPRVIKAPFRFALLKNAPFAVTRDRSAPSRFAPVKMVPTSVHPCRFARGMFAPV